MPWPKAPASDLLSPLRLPAFRMLWLTWLCANAGSLMSDVAAAWLMTSLTSSTTMTALVQTAAALPILLLSLPAGALADNVDPRRLLISAYLWVCAVSSALFALVLFQALSAWLVLALVLANGVGLALRGPTMAMLVPQLVERAELASAIALNGIAMNAARFIGPAIAGLVIMGLGDHWVFALNAVVSLILIGAVVRWTPPKRTRTLPRERLFAAIKSGTMFLVHSRPVHALLLRTAFFAFTSMALVALLPLMAGSFLGGGAAAYSWLMAAMGAGAVTAAWWLPQWRKTFDSNQLVCAGGVAHGACTAVAGLSGNFLVAVVALFLSGVAWMMVSNTLTTAAQMSFPAWVRARGMSMFQMTIMGAGATGAVVWGLLADPLGVPASLLVAGALALLGALLLRSVRIRIPPEDELQSQPAVRAGAPEIHLEDARGPIMTMIEYRLDKHNETAFFKLMELTRRSRLRNGASHWQLYRALEDPEHLVEVFLDPNWLEHRRRRDRMTAGDASLRLEREAQHQGGSHPVVRHFVAAMDVASTRTHRV